MNSFSKGDFASLGVFLQAEPPLSTGGGQDLNGLVTLGIGRPQLAALGLVALTTRTPWPPPRHGRAVTPV